MANNGDYYKILGVSYNASSVEIRDAYRKLVKKFHPDRIQNINEKNKANEYMKIINIAYDVLSDSSSREEYDKSIGISKTSNRYYSYNNNYANPNYQKYGKVGAPFDADFSGNRDPDEQEYNKTHFIFCPNCGQRQNTPDAEFCNKCGKPMTYYYYENKVKDVFAKAVDKKRILIMALIGGFLGFNGIGHFFVGKIFLGIVIMIFGWFFLILSVTNNYAKLIYLSYIILQTFDAYRRARILNKR